MSELSKRPTSRWEVLLALGLLLEVIPGESKFGPELCCCYRTYTKQKTLRNPSAPFQMLCINSRDLAGREPTCTIQAGPAADSCVAN